jgi:hypothetical protein
MADGLYLISYHPIGHGRDGKLHSIQVGLISPKDGRALLMKNERGTPIRYRIAASNRYVSAQEVEKLPAPSVLPKSSR